MVLRGANKKPKKPGGTREDTQLGDSSAVGIPWLGECNLGLPLPNRRRFGGRHRHSDHGSLWPLGGVFTVEKHP